LVGSQVLGVYVYGNYYPSLALSILNYVSTILASVVFILVAVKFYQAEKKNKLTMVKV